MISHKKNISHNAAILNFRSAPKRQNWQ